MSTNLTEVHGQFLNAARQPLRGSVIFSPCVPAPIDLDAEAVIVPAVPVTAALDPAGRFRVLLTASDDPGWHADCDIAYECDLRIEGIRDTHHLYVLSPGPHNLADLVRLPEPPYVIVQPTMGPPGPPGPPGQGLATYVTDLGAVTAGVPTVITHNLGTFDTQTGVLEKNHPGSGPSASHGVEADVKILSENEVSVTLSGSGLPTAPGAFRVYVQPLSILAAGG